MTLPNALPHSVNHNGPIDGQPEKRETSNGLMADTDALTRALRQSFQATVEEAVPDSLMDLINQLK